MDLITSHINADFDTFASMLAAKKLYPEATVAFSGSIEKGLKSALASLTIDFPIKRPKDIDLGGVTRLILVDVRHKSRIGPFSELIGRRGVVVHIYDHHPASGDDIKADILAECPYGSTTTLLTLIIRDRGIGLSPQEATILMAGVYEDTGFLSYPATTEKDYEAAAFLLSKKADLSRVASMLKKEMTPEEVSLLDMLLKSETVYPAGGIEVAIVEGYLEGHKADISTMAHRIMDIRGCAALFMLVETDGRVHIVARSAAKKVDAGVVLRTLGGGGHATAASATIRDATLIQAKDRLVSALKETIRPDRTASDIMSTPAITVPHAIDMQDGLALLKRYNINAAPVEENGAIRGVITRQVLDRAIYHGLSTRGVSEFMTTEFDSVAPDASIEEIREKVMGLGTRLLPVIKDNRISGVITRTDIIRLLEDELKKQGSVKVAAKKNLGRVLEERFPGWLIEVLRNAGKTAEGLSFKAYAVGGFVRDILLNRENLDVDIVIEHGDGVVFAEKFARQFGLRMKSHQRFKTAVIVFPGGFKLDVATARLEYYERPGALPTVEESSLKLDLYRRDFIINTLAICLNPDIFGVLIDFFGAEKDVRDKTIRVLHNLSFVEDPTRALRAVRFSEKFGFKISSHTLMLIKNSLRLDVFRALSGARLMAELKNILAEDSAAKSINRLHALGLLPLIHKGITWDAEGEALFERTKEAVAWHRLLYARDKAEAWLTLFLALTDGLKQDELIDLAKRLSISGKKRLLALSSRQAGLDALKSIESGGVKKGSVLWKALKPLPMEVIIYLIAKTDKEAAKKQISAYVTRLKDMSPILKGEDIKRLGVTEGPEMGGILNLLLEKRLDNEAETREDELNIVRQFISKKDRC